ncbi:MAG: phosphoribosylaminoimidazolesuccinocarboxamide synthase [Clostridia bacterium]|nr:phosphoribosylaminoimidazolesuccinocarboxamide synthase [Clostridia bacterium]MDD4686394.1 phosphoribosylaminoimidazolesuccinocarboxamide synthase [Clostridia bacterium]
MPTQEKQQNNGARLIKKGKTKDVYALPNGNVLLKFKDNITVGDDGKEDPGGNKAGGTRQNLGKQSLALTKYYFHLIDKNLNIPTHMVDANLAENTMEVLPIKTFGNGLEWICRAKAEGSFLKRNKNIMRGMPLNNLVEVSLKDDENGDPILNKNAFVCGGKYNWNGKEIDLGNGVISSPNFDLCYIYTKQITDLIIKDFKKRGLEFIDIKYEFGLTRTNKVVLIDEISAGSMRVFDKKGNKLEKDDIYEAVINDKNFGMSKRDMGRDL